MGAIGGLLGINGGINGTGFGTTAPTDASQIQGAYGGNQTALANQAALLSALQAQNGIGNQSQVYNQLQGVVNGTGANPAQAMLNNATGQNVANQAALMAGQRGAGSNVGLLARLAAQQGAGLQQNAAGQAAALQANQSLGALGQAGNLAGQQVANQMGATNANTNAQQSEQAQLLNANSAQNNVNAGLAGQTMKGQQGLLGGLLNSAGAAVGLTKPMAAGGEVGATGPQSSVAQYLLNMASGGKVPALVSPGERYLNKEQATEVAQGKKQAIKSGEIIPGKAKVPGAQNSYENDTVPKKLEKGGVVIPRSVTQSPDAKAKADAFVKAVLGHKKGK